MTRLYDRACDLIRSVYQKRIESPPILNPKVYFPNAPKFAERWMAIRDEALAIAQQLEAVPRFEQVMPEQAPLSSHDRRDWRVFIVKAYGIVIAQNMARCPALAALLGDAPEVLSATLSFLAPRKHIPRHQGPFRGVLRFQLGLAMPRTEDGRPAAVLTIEDTDFRIADGEWLLWDDTYPHEVRNGSDEVRVALLLDVWRRGMSVDMECLSRLVLGVVRVGMRYRGISFGN